VTEAVMFLSEKRVVSSEKDVIIYATKYIYIITTLLKL